MASIRYSAAQQFPESLDYDAKNGRFLVGSLLLSNVLAVYEDGRPPQVLVQDADYAGCATLGISVDVPRNRFAVTVHSNNPTKPFDGVGVYELDSGKRLFLVDLGALPAADPPRKGLPPFANDTAIDPVTGDLYVTDTNRSLLWRVASDGTDAAVFASDALFDSFPKVYVGGWDLGLNGIVVHPSGSYVITTCVRNGIIFKVPLPSGPAVRVECETLLPGIDVIRWQPDGKIVATSDKQTWLIASEDDWKSAKVLAEVAQDPSITATAVVVKPSGEAFVSYGYFAEAFGGVQRSDFVIQPVTF